MPKGKELTDIQKGGILVLEHHFSHAKIGAELGIPRQTVTDFIDHSQTRKSIENLPCSDRLRKTSKTADHWLVRNAESETCLPFKELKSNLNIDISKRMIQRRLREASIRKWRAVKWPQLNEKHAKTRLD